MTGFLNLTEVASKRKTMIPVFWNHGLNLMMLLRKQAFFCKKRILTALSVLNGYTLNAIIEVRKANGKGRILPSDRNIRFVLVGDCFF